MGAVGLRGKLYSIGGYSGITYLSTIEMYDPVKDTWVSLPDMRTARAYFAVTTTRKSVIEKRKTKTIPKLNTH